MSASPVVVEAKSGRNHSLNRAVTVTHSWLRSFDVPHEVQFPYIVVNGVTAGFDANASFVLDIDAILDAYDVPRVLAEVERLGKACGFKVPEVTSTYSRRTDIHDHHGRALSLNAVGKSARIPDAVFQEPYVKRIIQMEGDRAWRRYRELATWYGMDKDEFRHIARILAIPFLHRGADAEDEDQSARKFSRFLTQEFSRWAHIAWTDLPTQVPNIDWVVSGSPMVGAQKFAFTESRVNEKMRMDWEGLEPGNAVSFRNRVGAYVWDPTEMPQYEEQEALTEKQVRRLGREHNREMNARQEAAKSHLDAGLAAMPHDEMVKSLADVADSSDWGKDVRMAARARLAAHRADCAQCVSTSKAT